MSDQQQIAPCPFCGASGEDCVNVVDSYSGYWVQCEKCVSEGPCADSIKEAVNKWNTVHDKLAALEQKLAAAKAKCACLEDTLSELNDALMSRMASTRPNAKQRIRLINASIRASTDLLKLKGKK